MNIETQRLIFTLKRLKHQVEGAIVLAESNCVQPAPPYKALTQTPNTFEIGDFIVTDKQWTSCGPKGCGCSHP